jgi:two-component system response regulator CpxR
MDRVLIIDDDSEMCALLKEFLEPEFQIEAAHDGETGAHRANEGNYALLVLDVMLPGLNGFEVLRRLRANAVTSQLPVLMLTARGDDVDRIVGLELGADDYLAKPFNPRELAARIHAILRRSRPQTPAREVYGCNDVELDISARAVRRDGRIIELTAVEFDLLATLLKNAGNVVTRDEIAHQVFDRKRMAYDRSIDMHVSNLRKKLGPAQDGGDRIKSIRSVGYIFLRP